MLRRYWPLLLTIFCWLLVALVPATRQGVSVAWASWRAFFPGREPLPFEEFSRSPHASNRTSYEAYAVSVQIKNMLELEFDGLRTGRNTGPFSNPNYPSPPPQAQSSPPAQWHKFLVLARQGQKLEPDNSYFDWMLLYGLYATHRDTEALAVLKQAAGKSRFDAHAREVVLNSIALTRQYGASPLLPAQLVTANLEGTDNQLDICVQVTHWAMELALDDRRHKQHQQALNTAFNLMKLARVMRRNGYTVSEYYLGRRLEGFVLTHSALATPSVKVVRRNASLIAFRNNPLTLYAYAQSQHRNDIMRRTATEWQEMLIWDKAQLYTHDWLEDFSTPMLLLTGAQHLKELVLKTLQFSLCLAALFGCLSHRFPTHQEPLSKCRGGLWGIGLLFYLLCCSAIIAFNDNGKLSTIPSMYMFNGDVLSEASSWVLLGVPSVLVCLAAYKSFMWQKGQEAPSSKPRTGAKNIITGRELELFYFGWVLRTAMRLAFWFLVVASTLIFCFNEKKLWSQFTISGDVLAFCVMVALLLLWWGANLISWFHRAQRGPTVRLFVRLAFETLAGYLITVSVLYSVLAFGMWEPALNFQHNYESRVPKGELQVLRTKLGLK